MVTSTLSIVRLLRNRVQVLSWLLVLSLALTLSAGASVAGAAAVNTVTPRYAGSITEAVSGPVLSKPSALTIQGDQLYVLDAGNNRVVRYTLSGHTTPGSVVTATPTAQWGSLGTGNNNLNNPQGIAISHQGLVSVADTGNNRVIQFTSAGNYRRQWGGTRPGQSQFNQPRAITQSPLSHLLYVLDTGDNVLNRRIQYFNPGGNFQAQFTGQTFDSISANAAGTAIGADGRNVVADTGNNRVLEFSASGVPIRQFGTGTAGTELGQFSGPRDAEYGPAPYLVVLDSGNNRIQAYDTSGPNPRVISAFSQVTLDHTGAPLDQPRTLGNPNGARYISSGLLILADTQNDRIEFLWLDYSYVDPGDGGPDPIEYDLQPISYDGLPCTTCHQYDTRVEHNIKSGKQCLTCHDVVGRSGEIEFVELHDRISAELGTGGFDAIGTCGANSIACHSVASERTNQVLDGPKIQAAHANRTKPSEGWEPTTESSCSGDEGSCHSFGANPNDPATWEIPGDPNSTTASLKWFGSMDRASAHADYYRYQKQQKEGTGIIEGLAADDPRYDRDDPDPTIHGTVDITMFVNGCQICHRPDFTRSYGKLGFDYAYANDMPFSCESCHDPSGEYGSYSGRPECARTRHWSNVEATHPEGSVQQMSVASTDFAEPLSTTPTAEVSGYIQGLIESVLGTGDDGSSGGTQEPVVVTGSRQLPGFAAPASSAATLRDLLDR